DPARDRLSAPGDRVLSPVPPSLARRLLLRVSVVMLGALAALAVMVYAIFQSHIDNLQDRSLIGQAYDVQRALRFAPDGTALSLDLPTGLKSAYAENPQSFRFAVLDRKGRLLFGSPGVKGPLEPLAGVAGEADYFRMTDGQTGQVLIGITQEAIFDGRLVIIQAAQSISHADALADGLFDELADEAGWAIFTTFAVILLVLHWTLRRTLAPLSQASREAERLGPENPTERVGTQDLFGELHPLVTAVNSGLDRLQKAYEAQKEFTDNAAHELRTPLAVLRAHIDTLPDEGPVPALSRQVAVLEHTVDQLLRLARLDREQPLGSEKAELGAVAADVGELLGPIAADRCIDLSLEGEGDIWICGRAPLLQVALRNLVDNALVAVCTVAETERRVEIAYGGGERPFLTVSDSGPGVAPDDRERIFTRFARGKGAGGDGDGLGLSIVAKVAELHGAELRVGESPLGGARFEITFPKMGRFGAERSGTVSSV
ncbi:MAG: sensor histidine kinase, partial [Rhodospirillales bacterium]